MAHALEKYKLENEAEDHYQVKHPDGSSFKVAKSALSKEAHEKLKGYFGGGMVAADGYADGGEVDEAPEADEVPEGQPGASAAAYMSGQVPQDVLTNQAPVPAPQQGAAVPGAPGAPQPMSAEVGGEFEKALQGERGALEAQRQATAGLGQAEAPEYQDAATFTKKLLTDEQARQAKRQVINDDVRDRILKGQIDPNHLFENMGTGQRVGTAIGLLLSGFGGAQAVQTSMGFINKQISDDIEAQKANLSNLHTVYANNLKESQNDQQATTQSQLDYWNVAKAKLAQQASLNQSPQAQARYLQGSAAIDMQIAQLHQNLGLFAMRQRLATEPHPAQLGMFAADPKSEVILPDGKTAVQATSPQAAEKASAVIAAHQPALNTLDRLEQLRVNPAMPLSSKYQQAKSLGATLLLELKKQQGLGRVSPETLGILEKEFNDPTKFVDLVEGHTRTQQLRDSVQSSMGAQLQPYGAGFRALNAARVPFSRGTKKQ